MATNKDTKIEQIISLFDKISLVDSAIVPEIDLYMDQVTSFMERNLKNFSRHEGEDKILTKTMINNYAKNDLLPPPVKKKYSKEHVLILVFIYYFKNVMPLCDLQALLNPLTDRFFNKNGNDSITDIYNEVLKLSKSQIEMMKEDAVKMYNLAENSFEEVAEKDKEFLRDFAFVSMLSYDIYCKKLLIGKIVDDYFVKYEVKNDNKDKKTK